MKAKTRVMPGYVLTDSSLRIEQLEAALSALSGHVSTGLSGQSLNNTHVLHDLLWAEDLLKERVWQ